MEVQPPLFGLLELILAVDRDPARRVRPRCLDFERSIRSPKVVSSSKWPYPGLDSLRCVEPRQISDDQHFAEDGCQLVAAWWAPSWNQELSPLLQDAGKGGHR